MMKRLRIDIFLIFLILSFISLVVAQQQIVNATYTERFAQTNGIDGQWNVAFFSAEFQNNFAFSLGNCSSESLCDETSVIPCCAVCDDGGVTPANSTLNVPGCACGVILPIEDEEVLASCVDARGFTGTVGLMESSYFITWFTDTPCHNVLIFAETLSGDQDLQVSAGTATRGADRFLSDGFEVCCNGTEYNMNEGYQVIKVYGFRAGDFNLHIQEATAEYPNFLLDFPTYYALANYTLACEGSPVLNSQSDYKVLIAVPPAVPDLPLAYFNLYGGINGTQLTNLADNYLTFAMITSQKLYGLEQITFEGKIPTCKITSFLGDWYTVGANNQITSFPAGLSTSFKNKIVACDNTAFQDTITKVSSLYNKLDKSRSIIEATGYSTQIGALLASDAWYGCYQHALSLTDSDLDTRVIAETIECYAEPNTAEFMNDPCCNISLSFQYCCAPRSVRASNLATYTPNRLAIHQQCKSPVCTEQLLSETNEILDNFQGGICTNPDTFALLTEVQKQYSFVVPECKRRVLRRTPCEEASDCYSACVDGFCVIPDDQAEQQLYAAKCVIDELSPLINAQLRNILKQTNNSVDQYIEAFLTKYNTTACIAPDGSEVPADNEAECLSTLGCNWNPDIENESQCLNPYPWLGSAALSTNYCTKCDFLTKLCPDISRPPGCYLLNSSSLDDPVDASYCEDHGGAPVGDNCYLSNITTQAQCQPTNLCGSSSNNYCRAFCFFPKADTKQECEYPSPGSKLKNLKGNLIWDAQLELCKGSSVVTEDFCASYNATWFAGRGWRAGDFTTQATCTQACNTNIYLPVAQCTGACSQKCTAPCDQQKCEDLGFCNDAELKPKGRCTLPFANIGIQNYGCPKENFEIGQLGCYSLRRAIPPECDEHGGQMIMPASTKAECEQYVGCRETRFKRLSLKNPQQCEECGGDPETFFEWTPAVWLNGSLDDLTWQQREWAPINRWTWKFDVVEFQNAFAGIFYKLIGGVSKSEIACRYNRINQLIAQTTCDCVNEEQGCFQGIPPDELAITRFCSRLETEFEVSPVTLRTYNDTYYASGCTDVTISTISASLFKQSKTTLYSSLFFSSIQRNGYAVVENKDKQRVGQFVGDGIALDFNGKFQGSNVTLCITLDGKIEIQDNYKYPDFAVQTRNYTKFVPINAGRAVYNNGVICASVAESGTYFPIMRLDEWENKGYIDTLSRDVVVCCFIGAALFMLFFIFDAVRLATFIYFGIRKGWKESKIILPIVVFSILLASYTLRWVYFIAVPEGSLQTAPEAVNILIAELPMYLNFSVFLLIVLWWMEMLLFISSVQKSFLNRMRPAFFTINAVMYSLFIIVLIIFAAVPKKNENSCFVNSKQTSDASKIIGIIYKVTIAVVAFTLAAFVFIYGTRLLVLITNSKVASSSGNTKKIIRFTSVLLCISLGLALQCAILLYATFSTSGINTFAALVLVLIAELAPTGVLIFTMHPPIRETGELLKDTFWCCYASDTIVPEAGTTHSRASRAMTDRVTHGTQSKGTPLRHSTTVIPRTESEVMASNNGLQQGLSSGSIDET